MAKNNNQRIRELKTELNNLEEQLIQLKQEINDSKAFLKDISQYKESASQNHTEIENIKNTITSISIEITDIKESINNTKEDLNQKLNATEVKKENLDKFFIKIFGEEDAQGNYSGGLQERLLQKEKNINNFLDNQKNQYRVLFNKIESLLPAATSTGLATAFFKQKNSYKNAFWWIFLFYTCSNRNMYNRIN